MTIMQLLGVVIVLVRLDHHANYIGVFLTVSLQIRKKWKLSRRWWNLFIEHKIWLHIVGLINIIFVICNSCLYSCIHVGRIITKIKYIWKNVMTGDYYDKCNFQVYICIAAKMGVLLQKHTIEINSSVYMYT